jgi:hypothetical protein
MENDLLKAVQLLLDLKAEKKKYNTEINDQIKDAEREVEKLAKE